MSCFSVSSHLGSFPKPGAALFCPDAFLKVTSSAQILKIAFPTYPDAPLQGMGPRTNDKPGV